MHLLRLTIKHDISAQNKNAEIATNSRSNYEYNNPITTHAHRFKAIWNLGLLYCFILRGHANRPTLEKI